MTVTLSPQFEQYIEQKVAAGEYNSASDVLNAALHQLQHGEQYDEVDEEKIETVKKALQVADEQFAAGQYRTYTSETLHTLADEIKAEGRAGLVAQKSEQAKFSVDSVTK